MINIREAPANRRKIKDAAIELWISEGYHLRGGPAYLGAEIYTPKEEIDGHWLVRLHEGIKTLADSNHDEVIGVTSHQDRIPYKTYACALDYAKRIAAEQKTSVNDMTPCSIRPPEQTTPHPLKRS